MSLEITLSLRLFPAVSEIQRLAGVKSRFL